MSKVHPDALAMMEMPTDGGDPVHLRVMAGEPIFVLGANGTGKSALVHMIVDQLGGTAVYLQGARTATFEDVTLQMTPRSRRDFDINSRSWDRQPDTRWRHPSPAARNEKAIHDLHATETEYGQAAIDEIKLRVEATTTKAVERLQGQASPLDRLNRLLRQAGLPVEIIRVGSELKARRGSIDFSIAKMSDGERSALILIADVISSAPGSVFVIDEPELHLHRSIVVPLLKSVIVERPDCGFVVSTHELELPATIETARSLLIRGCVWNGDTIASWIIDQLPPAAEIPEDLRVDVLGSRRKILFIEGTDASRDQPLYSLLFPGVSLRPKNTSKGVRQAVDGLASVFQDHSVEPFGLIDNDHMAPDTISKLEARGIFALPMFAVESLYYCREARAAVAAMVQGSEAELLLNAETAAIEAASLAAEHLAARLAEYEIRERVLSELPARQDLASAGGTIAISLLSPYPTELAALRALVEAGDLEAIINRYPVRSSGVLEAIAKALKFSSQTQYEKAVREAVGADESLAVRLRAKLGSLSAKLSDATP